MKNSKHDLLLLLTKLLNVILITAPFALSWYMYYADRIVAPFFKRGNFVVIAFFVVFFVLFARIYDAFSVSVAHISENIYSQLLAIVFSDALMFMIIWLLTSTFPSPLPLFGCVLVQCVCAALWSLIAHKWYFSTFPAKRTAVIHDARTGIQQMIDDYGMTKRFDVRAVYDLQDCMSDLSVLDSVECVFLTDISSHERNIILKYCVHRGIDVYVLPRIGDLIMSSARPMHMFHLPILSVGRYAPGIEYLIFKRLLDILVSGIALLVLSPILLVTALAIKLTDKGPVFYKQNRLTKDGKIFKVIKFRSMRVDAEADGVARLSTGSSDDRITPVGRIIRKIRVDELPQLFNVLGGSMSLVGPRPERPEIAEQYLSELPDFALRLQAKAGITGYAQVYGKYNTPPYDKLQMDLMYIAHPSVLEDIRILLATVKILFMPESTEGIAEGQTTASDSQTVKK